MVHLFPLSGLAQCCCLQLYSASSNSWVSRLSFAYLSDSKGKYKQYLALLLLPIEKTKESHLHLNRREKSNIVKSIEILVSQVKGQKADAIPLKLIGKLSLNAGCKMNPQIKIKVLYESRIIFRGIQHFIASTIISNILVIFVIVNKGSSQFGSLPFTEISVKRTCKILGLSQKELLCTEQLQSESESSVLCYCPGTAQEAVFSLWLVRLPARSPPHPREVLQHCTIQRLGLLTGTLLVFSCARTAGGILAQSHIKRSLYCSSCTSWLHCLNLQNKNAVYCMHQSKAQQRTSFVRGCKKGFKLFFICLHRWIKILSFRRTNPDQSDCIPNQMQATMSLLCVAQ